MRKGGRTLDMLRAASITVCVLFLAVCLPSAGDCISPAPEFTATANDQVAWVAFVPESHLLAYASVDGRITLCDARTGRVHAQLGGPTSYVPVAVAPSGEILACRTLNGVELWDIRTGKLSRTLTGSVGRIMSLAFSPDGKLLALGLSDEVQVWEVATGQNVQTLAGLHREVESVAFAPNGQLVAAGGWHQARVWEVGTWKLLDTIDINGNYASPLAFSSNSKLLVLYNGTTCVRLYSLSGGAGAPAEYVTCLPQYSCSESWSELTSLAFSPDSRVLAVGAFDEVALWDVESETALRVLAGHANFVMSVAFSVDGRLLASGSLDNTVKVWDVLAALAPLSPEEILAWEEFHHYALSLEDMCNLEAQILDDQRKLTGLPWLDEGLRQFAIGTCKTMDDISRAITDLTGAALSAISIPFDLVETAQEVILEIMKEAAAEALGRPLSPAEVSAIDALYENTVGKIVGGAAEALEAEATARFSEFANGLNPRVIGEAAVGVLRSNILDYIAAFKGALVGGRLGILQSLKAVGVSALRDLARELKGINVYSIPLAIAFYLNDVTGTGKSASMTLLGLNKLDEAKTLARMCYDRPADDYSYSDICRLYQGYQLLRDACELFYQSFRVLTPQVGAIPEKASFWEDVMAGIDRNLLNPLGEAVCSVAKETLHTSVFDTLPIATGWYLGYGAGCGIKTNQ